ncbi:6-phosphogluconolactonase [Dactylosporangium aurantiacum]|uniref:6-phosphogluconolactonase n=1 Tax=Dactylosporangium aurantiacum TaxID=35754 RepID=A0A9Q9IIR4_9ACTN|nr:6-phosphogluconolactonase [Dactylosporangium aurantiacum]MDG6109481.1 6-phosphogluconolactonase [Dactylosporangium aurantiacum]UWZ56386.1 6-phosphogluconolactonase [Dactylosporangium aurantiacum]
MTSPQPSSRTVVVHDGPKLLAEAVAARLIVRLTDAQAERGVAAVVLTGGRIAAQIYAAVRDNPARDAVDWSRVDFWWGDERFLPSGDPDRNETQARDAFLAALPVDPARVRPMPASDGPHGSDAAAAAASYAAAIAGAHFDVVLLGVGEDGHVASVFPGHPVGADPRPVADVHDSPKPPPVRITLTVPTLNTAAEVWLLASGAGKADAVREALSSVSGAPGAADAAGVLPAARVHGRARTLWLVDTGALPGGV